MWVSLESLKAKGRFYEMKLFRILTSKVADIGKFTGNPIFVDFSSDLENKL